METSLLNSAVSPEESDNTQSGSRQSPQAWIIALGLFSLLAVGALDYVTGEEISFSIFYVPPIALIAWYGGRGIGLLGAAFAAAIWLWVELQTHQPFLLFFAPWWNASVRFSFFVGVVMFATMVQQSNQRLSMQVAQQTKKLEAASEQRRALEREMVELVAREQANMARDLHDGIGQYLSGLAFHAHMLADDLQRDASTHATKAYRLIEMIGAANQETRRFNKMLRVRGESEDLAVALRRMVQDMQQTFNITCAIDVPELVEGLDSLKADTLYRIAQEALNNAIKHGRATSIRVALRRSNHGWHLSVSDRGDGLPPKESFTEGVGLKIMRYRADLIGAQIRIGNSASGGCTVECQLPSLAPSNAST